MSSLLLILLSAALATVVALMSAPRWRPFAAAIDVYADARAVAGAALLIVPAVTFVNWLLSMYVLRPLGFEYLRTLVFMAVLLIVVSVVEAAIRRRGRWLPQRPGFALLLSANGAALGAALIAQTRMRSPLAALMLSIGAALGFGVLLLVLAALHERLRGADAPAVFREAPLALVTAGLIALGFMGFTGLVQE